jgi:prevent-host-death family protein
VNTITLSSDEARREWRELLDNAMVRGGEVVIERWNKPIAVLVNYEQRQKEKARLSALERERHAHLAFQIHDEMTADPAKDLA